MDRLGSEMGMPFIGYAKIKEKDRPEELSSV